MKTWRLASTRLRCGAGSECWIAADAAYLELAGEGWKKVRCETHAGQPKPDAVVVSDRPTFRPPSGFASTQQLARAARMGPKLLKFDPKMAQAGRDD